MSQDVDVAAGVVLTHDEVATRLAPAIVRITRRIRPVNGELSVGHFSTLASIERSGPQRPSDLARLERVSPPTMTRILAALEERGLLERHQSVDDARSVIVAITAQGVRLVAQARAEQVRAVAVLLQELDDAQVRRVAAALESLETLAQG